MNEPKSTSLAPRPAIPTGLIHHPQDLAAQLQQMQQHYNTLSPAIAVSEMAPGFGANLAVVVIDSTVTFDKERKSGTGPDTYYSKFLFQGDEQKRALNKQGILKISQAAGVQWDPNHCRRVDDGSIRNYWRWQYYGGVRTHDGQWQPITATRELDLRDGSAEALGMASSNQLAQARARGNEICETKAMERALRTLGIRQVYTVEELKKPFLIVRFSFTPDMSDPEIKKLVTQNAMAGIGALYQTPSAPMLPAPPPVSDTDHDNQEATASTSGAPAQPRHRTIDAVEFDVEAGLYGIRLDGGELVTTTDVALGKAVAAAKKAGQAIVPVITDGGELASFTVHQAKSAEASSTAAAAATGDLPPGQTRIEKVEKRTGSNARGGWTLYTVTFADGRVATTFSQTQQQLIDEAARLKTPVKVLTQESDGDYADKITLFEIVDSRQGSLPMADGGKY